MNMDELFRQIDEAFAKEEKEKEVYAEKYQAQH